MMSARKWRWGYQSVTFPLIENTTQSTRFFFSFYAAFAATMIN